MKRLFGPLGGIFAGLLIVSTAAQAQTVSGGASYSNSSAGRMWGSNNSTGTASDSSTMHSADGVSAGQVNAAKQGLLYAGGPGLTITAIGSQSIISTTVVGDGNSTNVNATQTTTNTGTVTNNGTIATSSP